jgi:hypothetical protein
MTLPIHLKKPPTCPSYRADANFTVGCNFRRDLRAGGVGRAFPDTVAAQEPGPSRYESRTCLVLRGSIRILQTTTITTDHAMNMIVAACAVIGTNAMNNAVHTSAAHIKARKRSGFIAGIMLMIMNTTIFHHVRQKEAVRTSWITVRTKIILT